ncbi:hypothetical protein C8J57DRAFT_736117 [Mycena rebaudengoi]|nr:hypothetical protein C8J57DRAFT_736117 [Mycena rebaudengoi]
MPPTPDEAALVASLFSSGSPHKLGVLTGDAALELFRYTNLPPRILGEVWNLADNDRAGSLSPARTEVAVRLIGWAQAGVQLTPDLIDKPGPLASIPNISGNHAGPSRLSTIPPFAPEDRPKFQNVFLNGSPTNGLIEGERAREIFMKSKLAPEVLSQVWDLSDTQCRGALDSTDFAIAMHLIQGLMLNKLSVLPAALPNGLYEHVAGCPVNTPTSPTSPRVKPAVANEQDQTAAHSVIIEANEAAQNQTAASPKNHHGVNDNTPVGSSPPSSRWPPLEELSLDYQPTS